MGTDHGERPARADFAALLRAARLTVGLTQAELSAKARVGIRTVRDLERGRAARPQRTTVDLLANALALEGEERARFAAAARGVAPDSAAPAARPGMREQPSPGQSPARPPTLALPAAIPLIGRDDELAAVESWLAVPGLVTLVGLAGVGKSSLGLAVLHRVMAAYAAGVAGIAVTENAAEADLLTAVATVFGVARASDLPARLAGAPALLMIDGVEQSAAVGRAVRWLCREAPQLRVLATGRRPLDLAGERIVPVEPLDVPATDAPRGLAEVAGYPAVELFLARLGAVRREPVTDEEAPALATLVRRLGGLPLALELAAARGRVLDPGEMLHRYRDRLLDLGAEPDDRDPGRGLRQAVAGSYQMLDPPARTALRRLCVFRGRWSVELAEELLDDDGDPIEVLDHLVGLGLVTVRGTGPFRFRLLDVVREFATEQATAAGELAAARRRHAQVIARLAARTAPDLVGANMPAAVNRLDHLAGDLWSALAYAADDDPHTALRLAAQLSRWWRFRGRDEVGRAALARLLADPRTADADPAVRAWAKVGVAQLAQEHGDGPAELPTAADALSEFQALRDVTGELAARTLLCSLWMASGGYDEALRHGEAALALATRTDRVRDMAVAQNNLTWHEIRLGELAGARRRLAAVDRLAAQCGELRLRVLARANLAEVARLDGKYDEAVAVAHAAAPLLEQLGDPGHRRRLLGTIALAHAQAGRLDKAEEIVAELRTLPGSDGAVATIEGFAALHRGQRELAAEWFTAAARANAGRHDARDLVEALVGLAASTPESERAPALAHLQEVCRRSGITLVPREQALLGRP